MSLLAKLLDAKQPLFDLALDELEQRTGRDGVDARLAAEITSVAAQKTRELGLEPDCSGQQLYEALINKVKQHNEHLAAKWGGGDEDDIQTQLPRIEKAALEMNVPRDGWFLKHEVAAQMLEHMPPEAIIDRLGYANAYDMVRSESIEEIFLALRFGQDADWLNQFNELYKKLVPEDFEAREIRLVPFDVKKWGNIAEHFIQKKLHNITNSKEIGAIAIMPMAIKRMPGIILKDLPLILHYYNEIRLYSAFFKLIKTKRNFGELISETLIADPSTASIVKGQKVHWRVIQRYFGKLPKEQHPEIFEPHLQPEDLHWRKAEETLYEYDNELSFWKDLDFVGVFKGDDIVTFSLLDVSFSYSNQLSYQERYIYHFRESLWNEVFARYMGQKTLEEQLLVKLDNEVIAPETLRFEA
jgi:hypothetical protein